MREIYIRESRHTVIESVREGPKEIVYLPVQEPQRLGFTGAVGVGVFLVALVIAAAAVSTAFAQSNVRQFYGWGNYGANNGTTVIIVPSAPQPRPMPYLDNNVRNDCGLEPDGKNEFCYFQGVLDMRCEVKIVNNVRICSIIDGRPVR